MTFSRSFLAAALLGYFSSVAYADVQVDSLMPWPLKLTNAASAWSITQGIPSVVVAVIDTGVDISHPRLADNIWQNPGESGLDSEGRDKSKNGIDDDKNGYIDDVHGWNFVTNTNKIDDEHGHGTHVAGIVQGTAPKVRLMVLKYFDASLSGENNIKNTVKAIRYAVQMNATIINYSGGGTSKYLDEELAIQEAEKKNILFVAAAGNEKSNSDERGFYPADYGLTNIVSVTAIDENQTILPSSNYGVRTVDIAAPGKDIYSTLPKGGFGLMTGTSQATAYVSGAAALILSENQTLRDPEKVISILTRTGLQNDRLIGKTKLETRLDTYRSLIMKDRDQDAFGNVSSMTSDLQIEDLPFKKSKVPDKY